MRTTRAKARQRQRQRRDRRHREDRREIAPIEAALREGASDERGERIAHEVAARGPEEAQRALRQHRGRGEHREPCDAEGEYST